MSFRTHVPIWLVLSFLFAAPVSGQSFSRLLGIPPIQNYATETFGAAPQNWAVVQDHRGFIYVGNSAGVLEFDGARWRLIPTQNGTTARSIDVSASGRIFVGAQNDIGMLAPDSLGSLRFVSFLDSLNEADRHFGDVWRTIAVGDKVYFNSLTQIMRWDGRRMDVIKTRHRFLFLHRVRDELYTTEYGGKGVSRLVGDTLAAVEGTDALIEEGCLPYFMMPYPGSQALVGTNECGLFLLGDGGAEPFPTEIDSLLHLSIYHGTAISDSLFAIASNRDGFVIIDSKGRLVTQLRKQTGLIDDQIRFVYPDRQYGLWAATNQGVSRVSFPHSTTVFDQRLGMEGLPYQVAFHNGRVYFNSTAGLQTVLPSRPSLSKRSTSPPAMISLEPVKGWVHRAAAELLYFSGDLYHVEGLRVVRNDPPADYEVGIPYSMHVPPHRSSSLFAGTENGIVHFVRDHGAWRKTGRLEGVSTTVRTMASDRAGNLLLTSDYDGVLRVEYSGSKARLIPLTAGGDTLDYTDQYLFQSGSTIYLGYSAQSDDGRPGLLRYNEESGTFELDTSFSDDFHDGRRRVFRMVPDEQGNFWMRTRIDGVGESGVAWRRPDGRYEWDPVLSHLPDGTVYDILPMGDSLVWLAHQKGLFRYDRRSREIRKREVPVYIRRVLVREDSLLFDGGPLQDFASPVLQHGENSFRFEYAAASMELHEMTRYQTMLEGLENEWSGWTAETHSDFTNLSPGSYRFRMRARDVYGTLSDESVFAFVIMPPWYRTWWAYVLYVVLVLGTLVPVTRYYAQRRLRRRVEQLEMGERLHVERQRISRDLHDHVGSQLMNILSSIELVRLTNGDESVRTTQAVLDTLDEDARTTITRLRETIWAIHQESVTPARLGEQILGFAHRLLKHRQRPRFRCTVNEELESVVLSPFQALNLFRIVQEAVTNSIKYADADLIEVEISRRRGGDLSLVVRDDGTFVEPDGSGDGSLSGYGIPGMRRRAEELNGSLLLETETGTSIEVLIPV